jgi:hypothetical protein
MHDARCVRKSQGVSYLGDDPERFLERELRLATQAVAERIRPR